LDEKLKKFLKGINKIVYPLTTHELYEDMIEIAKNLHPVSLNAIYTLNNADSTYSFMKQNDILKYFDIIIETENKNAHSLSNGLRGYSNALESTLEYTPMLVFGDNRCDLDCSCSEEYEDKKLYIGLESGLEKKIIEFKEKCDIFVPLHVRKDKDTMKHINQMIKEYIDSIVYSDKVNKTDIFKYMQAYFNQNDKKNTSSYQ